jgi:hypothetical protein
VATSFCVPSSTEPEATVAERPTRNSDQSTIEESSDFMNLFLRRGVCRGVSFRIQRSRRKLAATSECSPEPVV